MIEPMDSEQVDPVPEESNLPEFPPPKMNDNLVANLPSYQLFSNAYKGGRYVKRPPKGTLDPDTGGTLEGNNRNSSGAGVASYLRVLPKEKSDEYLERLNRSYYLNYCQEIVRVYSATFFQQGYQIERQGIVEALGPEIAGNIDGLGRGITDFLRDAWREALVFGWIGVLTDSPRAGPFPSLAIQRASSPRPYSRIVLPKDVWDWAVSPATGDWSYLLLSEGNGVWIVWTPEAWYQISETGEIIDYGEHSFGRVPFDLLVADPASLDDPDEPFGHSALRDCASINLEIYQQTSLRESLARKINYPTRVWSLSPEEYRRATEGKGNDLALGTGYDIMSPASVSWITPPDSSMRAAADYIADLVREIRRVAGIATRSEESTEAHSGAALQWEYSTRLSLVKLRAENLRAFEVKLWRTFARALKKEIPAESVKYPSTYVTQPTPEDLTDLEAMQSSAMPVEVIKDQMRSIVIKRFSHLPDIQEKLEVIDNYVAPASVANEIASIELLEKAKAPQALIKGILRGIVEKYFSNAVDLAAFEKQLRDEDLYYYTDPTLIALRESPPPLDPSLEAGSGEVIK